MHPNPRKTSTIRPLGPVDIARLREAVLAIPEALWDAENASKPNRFGALDATPFELTNLGQIMKNRDHRSHLPGRIQHFASGYLHRQRTIIFVIDQFDLCLTASFRR